MILVLTIAAALWGFGHLMGTPHRARWLMIGLLYIAVQALRIAPSGECINMRVSLALCFECSNLKEIELAPFSGAHSVTMPEQAIVQMILLKQRLKLLEEIFALVQVYRKRSDRTRCVKMR